jgi:hypothetical protein
VKKASPTGPRLVALSALGGMLFSYPLMSMENVPALIFGVPRLYAYLFGVWLAFVGLVALLVET